MMREVRVLEIITTPMRRDGLTLAPLRLAGRMARVRCDFAAELRGRRWHPRRRRGGGREAVRRAEPPAQAGSLRPVPRAPDSGKRLCDRPRSRQFLHAGHRPARCEARRRAGAHRAQPQFRLPLPAVAPAAATAVRPSVHPRDGVRHGGGPIGGFRVGRSRSSEIPSIRTRSRSIPPRANRCARSSGWAGRRPLAAWPASCPRRTTRFCSTPSPAR